MEMEQPISDADSANLGSKWGAAVKAMSTDPMAQKIVYEVEAAGCCYPPFMCMIDKNVVKYAKERSYTWVLEGGIEKNMYAPQVVCGCISLQALCPCCGCPGKDNIEKYYFDHAPFMGPKTGFATEKDINWCCYIPFLFEGVPCDCCDKCCTTPCYGTHSQNRTQACAPLVLHPRPSSNIFFMCPSRVVAQEARSCLSTRWVRAASRAVRRRNISSMPRDAAPAHAAGLLAARIHF